MTDELILVGDRVLIEPDEGDDRTDSGLYLPQGVKEREKVQAGRVIKTGPGYPLPDAASLEAEPWQTVEVRQKYFPLQAREGDYCIFLRSSGVEVSYDNKKYVVVPHAAILILRREHYDSPLPGRD